MRVCVSVCVCVCVQWTQDVRSSRVTNPSLTPTDDESSSCQFVHLFVSVCLCLCLCVLAASAFTLICIVFVAMML